MALTELPFGLKGKVFRSPMPFGMFDYRKDTYNDYSKNSVHTIVMLNDEDEYLSHAGRDLKELYLKDGYNLIHLPMPDFSVPTIDELRVAVQETIEKAKAGENIVVHCHAGMGRAGLFLGVMAKDVLGMQGNEAIEWVRSYVAGAIQTEEQAEYVISY